MAPVIWGLDLKEIQWGKFKNSYMWNNEYHLRRTKFIVYQMAMILCVVSESLGTDALSKYTSEQRAVERQSKGLISIKNNDIVGSFSFNIFVGVFIATIFGAAFFFDLFWPERHESQAVRIAWKACGVLASCLALASAISLTVILATHTATISYRGTGRAGFEAPQKPPLKYKKNGEAIASVVLIWLGWVATCASTELLFSSINHIEKLGPMASHLRGSKDEIKEEEKPATPRTTTTAGQPLNGQGHGANVDF